jgi:hypothetical protein
MKSSNKLPAILKMLSSEEVAALRQRKPEEFSVYFAAVKPEKHTTLLNDFINEYSSKSVARKMTADQAEEELYAAASELLINSAGTENNSLYDLRAAEIFRCKRELLLFDILSYRGVRENAFQELTAIKSRLQKVESYDLITEVCERMVKYLSFYGRQAEIKKARAEKEKYVRLAAALQRTIELYFSNIPTNIPDSALQNYVEYFSSILKEIAAIQRWAKSKQISYFQKLIEFMYFDLDRQFDKCSEKVIEIKKLLVQNKFLFSNPRMHQNYLNGAYCLNRQYKFKEALELVKKSKAFAGSATNRLVGDSIEAGIYIASGNAALYNNKLEKLYREINDRTPAFLQLQLSALYAASCFQLNDLASSYSVVQRGLQFPHDHDGWYHHLIVLKLMLLIERENYDIADVEIENFRKKVERKKSMSFHFDRLVLLKRMFVVLSKSSYDFSKAKRTLNKLLQSIESDPKLRWSPGSPELLPIDRWFLDKLNRRKFDQREAVIAYKELHDQ